jgi:hypothetical protein
VRGFTFGGSGTASTEAIAISAPRTHTMGEFDFIPACVAIAKREGRLSRHVAAQPSPVRKATRVDRLTTEPVNNVNLRPPTLFRNIVDSTVSDLSQNWPF